MMLAIEMPRKDTKLRLDERILEALRAKSIESGVSFNALCEGILFSYAKSVGKLPIDAEPLRDPRGGKRVKGESKFKKPIGVADGEPIAIADDTDGESIE